jgi:hypothetical protein
VDAAAGAFSTWGAHGGAITLSNGDLTATGSNANDSVNGALLNNTGIRHVEFTIDTFIAGLAVGLANSSHTVTGASSWLGTNNSYGMNVSTKAQFMNGAGVGSYGGSFTAITASGQTLAMQIDFTLSPPSVRFKTVGSASWGIWSSLTGTGLTSPLYPAAQPTSGGVVTINTGGSAFLEALAGATAWG